MDRRIGNFVEANDLGEVFNADTGFIIELGPDTVRAPDVSFVRKENIPPGGIPKGFIPGAPDLAVEVISPSDSYTEVAEKVAQLLQAGTQLVVLIDPRARTVSLRYDGEIDRLTEARRPDTRRSPARLPMPPSPNCSSEICKSPFPLDGGRLGWG